MLAEVRSLAAPDAVNALPPLGYEANREGIHLAIQWAFEQKIIPRRFYVDELFDDTTTLLNARDILWVRDLHRTESIHLG
jgi:4,5-dihydroxyphthalate decarboxylase